MDDDLQPWPLKQGDTWELVCQLEIDGVAQELDDVTIESNARPRGGPVAFECTVEKIEDDEGKLTIFKLTAAPAATAEAPLGLLESDISYVFADGSRDTTPTFTIDCQRRIK